MSIDLFRLPRILALAFLGTFICMFGLAFGPESAQAAAVHIPNQNLKSLIRQELHDNQNLSDIYERDITAADMLLVKKIECQGADLSDLTGLEYAANVEELNLHTCQVKDLKPLTNLTRLKILKLNNNSFKDITPLKNLTNLQVLWLQENKVDDFSPLQNLTNLEYLHLPQRMKDISSLKNLTKLKDLALTTSVFEELPVHILDISPLAGMTELQNLYMNHNNINDLSPLQNAVNLEHLEICGNNSYIGWTSNKLFYNVGFSDISPLKNLTKLKYLDFSGNRVEDISVLAGMPALQKLYFSYNNVRNISALQDLLLQELDCSNNYLEVLWGDTEPLSAAAETIQTLTRRGTTINYSNQDPSHADLSYPQLSAAANNPAGVQVSVAPNDTREIDVLHIKLSLPANASDSCLINSLVFDFSGQEKNGKLIDAAAVNVVSLYREYDYPSGPTEKLGQQKGGSQITFSGLNQLLEPGQTQYYILRYTLDKSDPNNATYGATINPGKIGATSAASGQGLIVRGSAAQGTFFRKGGTLKLDVMPGGSGTVAATPSWTSYGAGDQVTLTATPAPGYVLDYFHNQQNTGETDWKIRQNPAVITVNWTEDAEGKITAIFDKEPTSSDGKKHGKLKDPVNTATGEFYFETPLFDLGGPLPMKSSLYYGSALSGNTDVNSAFGHVIGANWLHNYQMACLHKNDQEAAVIYDRGKTLNFARNGTAWELSDTLDIAYSLKNDSAGNFYLLDPDKELVYIFNTDQRLSRVEDRKGNRHTLTYDTSGNLATVSDGLGRSLNFSYQDTRLAAISDGYGRTWRFGYTGQVLASLTDPMGNVTGFTCSDKAKQGLIATVTCPRGNQPYTQTYDSEGRVIKQTDTYGDVTGLDFSGQTQGITTISYPDQSTVLHTHLSRQLLSGLTDPSGNKIAMEYDSNQRNTLIRDRTGGETEFGYQAQSGKIASITNPQGEKLSYTYTSQEQRFGEVMFTFYNVTRIDYPDGSAEKYTYDANGNIIKRVDRNGHTWQYTLNQHGQVTGVTNPAGGQETREFNSDGTLSAVSDTDTSKTTYAYDDLRRLKSIREAGDINTIIEYDLNDRPIAVTVPGGQRQTYEYDANGNLVKETCGDRVLAYTYDDMDRLIKSADETGKTNSIAYDAMGRPQSITDALGNSQRFKYDSNGCLTGIVDRAGQEWRFGYDAEGVLETETLPAGQKYSYTKDLRGYITGITDPLGKRMSIDRDYLGRVTAITDQLGLKTCYTYDGQGNLTGVAMPGGSTSYSYNELGLPGSIKDLNQNNWTFSYTPMGKIAAWDDPLGSRTRFSYDRNGRLVRIDYPDGENAQLSYNSAGGLSLKTYSSGLEISYVYDAMDRPAAVNGLNLTYNRDDQVTATQDTETGITFGAGYDQEEQIIRADYNNGEFHVDYTYDQRGQLTRVEDSLTNNWVEFIYDDNGNLIKTSRSNGINTTLTWDEAGRLTGIEDGSLASQKYSLDQAGNVKQADCRLPLDPAVLLAASENKFNYDTACQTNTSGYTYDVRGRRTKSPTGTYGWDAEGRLISAGSAQMSYNGWGDILTRSEGNQTARYFYNYGLGLAPIAAEKNETDGKFTYYVWTPEGRLLYGIDGAAKRVFFYHSDRQGSTQFLTDQEGKITDSYAYTPYGQLLEHQGSSSQPFTYAGAMGARQEGSSGLYQMRERYYDAITGSFLSRDPLWPDLFSPGSLNPYAYVNGNPVSYIDPTGEEGKKGETVYGSGGVKANPGSGSILDTSKNVGSAVSATNTTVRVGSKAISLGGKLSQAAAASKFIGAASQVSNVAGKVAVPLTVAGGLIDAGRAAKMTYIMIKKPSGQAYGKLKGELGAQYVRYFWGDKKDQADVIREMQSGFVSRLVMKATGAVYEFFAGR